MKPINTLNQTAAAQVAVKLNQTAAAQVAVKPTNRKARMLAKLNTIGKRLALSGAAQYK